MVSKIIEPFRKSYAAQEVMSWPTVGRGWGLQSLQLEVNGAADGDATRSGQVITAVVEKDFVQGGDFLNICKWNRNSGPYAASGDLLINTLKTRGAVQSFHGKNGRSGGI